MKLLFRYILFIFSICLFFYGCKNKQEIQKKLEKAGSFYLEKDIDSALKLYNETLQMDGSNLQALMMSGKILFFKKDYERSLALFEKALKLDNKNLIVSYWVAKAESQIPGKKEFALNRLNAIIEISPSSIETQYVKATVLESEGKVQEAFRSYNQIIQEQNKITLVYLRLARVYKKAGMQDMSKKHLERAKILGVDSPEILDVIKKTESNNDFDDQEIGAIEKK